MNSGQGTMGSVLGNGREVLSEEVPAGYKRTEVVVIPEEWSIHHLGTICDVRDGTHESPRFYSTGVPLITSKNIVNGSLDLENISCISEQDADRINERSKVDFNDILMSMIGTIGSTVLIDFEPDFCIKNVALIKPQKVLPKFLIQLMASPLFQTYLKDSLDGGIQKFIALGTLRGLNIPLPPTSEQHTIAETLSDMDGLLAALEALIAKKRAVKQAAMQQLLTGKSRLPGFSGEWETTTVGEVADIRNGATPSTQIGAYWNGPIPWCTPTDITATPGKYLCATERSITAVGLANCAASLLPVGALLLCSRATIGEIKIAASSVCTNQGFKSLVCKDGVSNEFLYYLILTLKPQMIERAIGSTFLEIGKRDVASIELCVPTTYTEQRAIATILSDMDAEIAVLERRQEKTRAIKQGMMQQLLTGRVRLVKPETTTEELAASRPVERKHNWQFNEAVVISVLAKQFGSEQYPLGRMRYTKLSYLLHRREEGHVEGYLKKAAGPYNPKTRYGGPEKIALKKGYADRHKSRKHTGFIAGTNIEEAGDYFTKWYGDDALEWLEQFRYSRNDELELLTTVDMTVEDLRKPGKNISVESVKETIRHQPDWRAKLDRPIFSDANLARAIGDCQKLFDRSSRQDPV